MDRYELRREDYSLSADQTDLQAAYAKFFQQHSTIETVRAAESTGFDRDLWSRLCGTGATSMALPEDVGGDGATLVDLTLVAEEAGRWLAPVPWIDHVVGSRLLARLDALGAGGTASEIVSGTRIVAIDAQLDTSVGARLVPAGAIADHVVVREGDDIVLLTFDNNAPARVDNLGKLPMAWVDPAEASARRIVGSGPDAVAAYLRALDEWRILTAAALVGLVEQTMRIAAEFATTRYTYGVPISSLQAISHPLANMAISVEGGRALARKAAWYLDVEPDVRPELAGAVFVFMAEEAPRAATLAVHVQGGLGVTTEAAATAYLVRARGWALAGGDPAATAKRVAHLVASRPEHVPSVPAVVAV
jgi:alkylation response protein AidB-like acyl-CoA dehydrogenase